MRKATHHADAEVRFRAKLGFVLKDDWLANWEGEAPAEPRRSVEIRLGGSLALPKKRLLKQSLILDAWKNYLENADNLSSLTAAMKIYLQKLIDVLSQREVARRTAASLATRTL